jgi:hypothetical protein
MAMDQSGQLSSDSASEGTDATDSLPVMPPNQEELFFFLCPSPYSSSPYSSPNIIPGTPPSMNLMQYDLSDRSRLCPSHRYPKDSTDGSVDRLVSSTNTTALTSESDNTLTVHLANDQEDGLMPNTDVLDHDSDVIIISSDNDSDFEVISISDDSDATIAPSDYQTDTDSDATIAPPDYQTDTYSDATIAPPDHQTDASL